MFIIKGIKEEWMKYPANDITVSSQLRLLKELKQNR